MFTGARKKKREMDWQLVASYYTVKSIDIFAVIKLREKIWIVAVSRDPISLRKSPKSR